MCLPAVTQFKRSFPQAETHFLVAHTYADLLAYHRNYDIDYLHIYRRIAGPTGWWEIVKTAGLLRNLRFDFVFDWQANPRSRLLLSTVGAKKTLSFNRFMRMHQLEKCYLTLKEFGISPPKVHETVRLAGEAEERWAEQLLAKVPDKCKKIALGIGGIWKTKLYENQAFCHVMEIILRKIDARFVLIGDERDKFRAEELARFYPEHTINLVGKTTILQASAVIRNCDLTISNDTSAMHLSWIQGKPTIGIYGATDPQRTGPLGEKSFAFSGLLLPCHPCFSADCKIKEIEEMRCLRQISPRKVGEKAVALLT